MALVGCWASHIDTSVGADATDAHVARHGVGRVVAWGVVELAWIGADAGNTDAGGVTLV